MSKLEEKRVVDQMEIVGPFRFLQIRMANIILRDGEEISREFIRCIITPIDDISDQSDEVKDICLVIHTEEIKEAYKSSLEF